MDSAVLGLAPCDLGWYGARLHHGFCRVRVSPMWPWLVWCSAFDWMFALEEVIEFHAFAPPLEALPCVCQWHSCHASLLLLFDTVHFVQTLKVHSSYCLTL
jgi:hypothetical protein